VIHMVIPTSVLMKRADRTKGTCKQGGEIYNIYERPPKVEGICDADGGEASSPRGRSRKKLWRPG